MRIQLNFGFNFEAFGKLFQQIYGLLSLILESTRFCSMASIFHCVLSHKNQFEMFWLLGGFLFRLFGIFAQFRWHYRSNVTLFPAPISHIQMLINRKIKTNVSDTFKLRGWILRRGSHFPSADSTMISLLLSDHFHVYSVLTFCLASSKKNDAQCLVFIYRCVNYFRVDFSSPFFRVTKSLSEWIKNCKTTTVRAIKTNAPTRWKFSPTQQEDVWRLMIYSLCFLITLLKLLIFDYSWIFHPLFTFKFQLELSIRHHE